MKNFLLLLCTAFILSLGISSFGLSSAHAQSVSALQAEQVAAKNYAANPTVANENILLSAMSTVNSQASTPGNTTQPNAQSIEQAANNALNNTPAPAASSGSVNAATAQQIEKQSAQTASVVAQGGSCAPLTANGNDQTCATGLACDQNGICSTPPANNSVGLNGSCDGNDSACTTGLTCNDSGICVAATTPATAATATSGSGNFVPLTNLPIFNTSAGLTTAPDLASFFNALYKYCIGIAATLAVLQIMRAGIMYMGGDSITETKEARRLIGTAIAGLVLVLSPYVIFSIINPKILSLNLGTDLTALTPSTAATTATAPLTASNGTVTAPCTVADIGTCGDQAPSTVSIPAVTNTPAAPLTTTNDTGGPLLDQAAPVSTSYTSTPTNAPVLSSFKDSMNTTP